jgi:hypothetical protein
MSYAPHQQHGAADSYYQQQQQYYQPPPPGHEYHQNGFLNDGGQLPYNPSPAQFSQAPPLYGKSAEISSEEKLDFDNTFKVEKPTWNDIWASVVFALVCVGFLIVSGFAISGYSATTKGQQGGIHDKHATLALNANTIALLCVPYLLPLVQESIY